VNNGLKGCRKKRLLPSLNYSSGICLNGMKKTMKTLRRVDFSSVDPKTSQI